MRVGVLSGAMLALSAKVSCHSILVKPQALVFPFLLMKFDSMEFLSLSLLKLSFMKLLSQSLQNPFFP